MTLPARRERSGTVKWRVEHVCLERLSDRDRAAEGGEEDQALAHGQASGLGQAAAVELELRGVVGGLGQGLVVGDVVGLVID